MGAFVAAVIAGTIGAAGEDTSVGEAFAAGTQVGFTVLLSWAIARELDPDHPSSATAAVVAGVAIFFTGEVRLAVVTTMLFATRIVTRSPGKPPTTIDLLWLLGLCAFGAKTPAGWIGGVALGVALMWDARLERPAQPVSIAVGAVGIIAAAVVAVTVGDPLPGWAIPSASEIAVFVAGSLGAIALLSLRHDHVLSVEDYSDRRMSSSRVNRGRALAVAVAIASVALVGGQSAPTFVGVWAALIGVGIRVLFGMSFARKQVIA